MARELTDEQRARLAKAIREQVWPRVRNADQTSVGLALGALPSTINRLMAKNPTGGSHRLAAAVAEFLNEPKEAILDGEAPEQPVPRLREIAGYSDARSEAERRIVEERRAIESRALEKASDVRIVPVPTSVNATMLLGIATSFQEPPGHSPSERRVKTARKK